MKAIKSKTIKIVGLLSVACMLVVSSFAQTRKLPDGSIIYSDGTRRLPNGTVIYKSGTNGNNNRGVFYPDQSRQYPANGRRTRNRYEQNLPPGQAKKIYGGRANDYAPGQQGKWKGRKEHDDNRNENDNHDRNEGNHGRGEGHRD